MGKPLFQKLNETGTAYIQVKKDGRDVIRVSNHAPNPHRLRSGADTKHCKNVYLIFLRSKIDETRENGAELADLMRLQESGDAEERILGEVSLNNLIVEIGDKAKKGVNYQIIDGNSEREINEAIKNATKMLKTTVFVPLKYIRLV